MIKVNIQPEEIELAKQKAQEMGNLKNSIRKGEGNIVGFLGEIIFAKYFDGKIQNTYDYDVILNDKKIDVKTKETTVEPQPYYYASVAAFNIKQKCDGYYFVRVKKDLSVGWLLGGMSKSEFYSKAIFNKAGEEDPSSDFGWKFRADCYNLEIKDLIEKFE